MPRADLERIPAETEILRAVRYMRDDAFDDITLDDLARAVEWLHAAAYSARQGAHRIERLIATRQKETTP